MNMHDEIPVFLILFFSTFSVALSGMSYTSLYIARTLKVFSQRRSRYPSIRLCATLAPVVFAVLVAASRTADYHHHWQGRCESLTIFMGFFFVL